MQMKYYHVSITACRLTLIDFFTPNHTIRGRAVTRHFCRFLLMKYVCFHHNECLFIFAEGAAIPRHIIKMFSQITSEGGLRSGCLYFYETSLHKRLIDKLMEGLPRLRFVMQNCNRFLGAVNSVIIPAAGDRNIGGDVTNPS